MRGMMISFIFMGVAANHALDARNWSNAEREIG